ncbi:MULTISPECIES: hypothetical protein [Paenibacillus]|uniref:Uncharacterized protein n=1 Tax=Paenibacillus lignilyticus TaxID=1172615 RepID=A0ABS5C855_9BACL|nr:MULTISPECIES: hypothetical protein [Paenibacillus]MBP3962176.1 hypothetical protein [Paenibacillus lignilyticus]SDX20754.1 hypothetical protein SAMN05518855_1010123 [Paenibacillus sp. CF384]
MANVAVKQQTERDGKSLFFVMKIAAWTALCVGLVLCLFNINDFSDSNATLMSGVGFMVGSVFIYMIGTAMSLVHKRSSESLSE